MNNILNVFDPENYPTIRPLNDFTDEFMPPGINRVRGNVESDAFVLDRDRKSTRLNSSH